MNEFVIKKKKIYGRTVFVVYSTRTERPIFYIRKNLLHNEWRVFTEKDETFPKCFAKLKQKENSIDIILYPESDISESYRLSKNIEDEIVFERFYGNSPFESNLEIASSGMGVALSGLEVSITSCKIPGQLSANITLVDKKISMIIASSQDNSNISSLKLCLIPLAIALLKY